MITILKETDTKKALKQTMITSQTKNLVKAGVAGNANFPELLFKYKWTGTRDYSMALIIIAFCNYYVKENPTDSTAKNLFIKLLKELKVGNRSNIKTYVQDNDFTKIFKTVLKKHDTKLTDEKITDTYNQFEKQAEKIKPWVINGDIIADLVSKFLGTQNTEKAASTDNDFLRSIENQTINDQDVKTILGKRPSLANATDKETGKTALMYAIIKRDSNIVKTLLENSCDVNAKDKDGKTALIYSIIHGQPNIADQLLNKGANTDKATQYIQNRKDTSFNDIKAKIEKLLSEK